MLFCLSIVLNVAPFAKTQKASGAVAGHAVPGDNAEPRIATFIERLDVAELAPQPSRAAAVPQDVPEPIKTTVQPMPVLLASTAPAAAPAPADSAARLNQDHAVAEKSSIEGVWAPDAGACSAHAFKDGALPTVINAEGAWAGETFCIFTKRTETDKGWRIVAKCSAQGETWTSRVQLTVKDNRLIWTSQRGTQAYSRCRPDILMAQAR